MLVKSLVLLGAAGAFVYTLASSGPGSQYLYAPQATATLRSAPAQAEQESVTLWKASRPQAAAAVSSAGAALSSAEKSSAPASSAQASSVRPEPDQTFDFPFFERDGDGDGKRGKHKDGRRDD